MDLKRPALVAVAAVALAGCGSAESEGSGNEALPAVANTQVPSEPDRPTHRPTAPAAATHPSSTITTEVSQSAPDPQLETQGDDEFLPWGDGVHRLRMSGFVRGGWDFGDDLGFCFALGEDGSQSCTGISILVDGNLPNGFEWDYRDDLVWYRSGMYDFTYDAGIIRDLATADVPPEAIELARARDFVTLIERYPEYVASEALSWLPASTLVRLPEDRVVRLEGQPHRGPVNEQLTLQVADELTATLEDLDFFVPGSVGEQFTNDDAVVVQVPHSPELYADLIASRAESVALPTLLIVSSSVPLDG